MRFVLRHSRQQRLLMLRLLVLASALLAAGCSLGQNIGDGAIGVWVDNECAQPIQAESAHTAELAVERLGSTPIEIPSGEGRGVSVIANAAFEPTAYFLAIRVGTDDPLVREFDIEQLQSELVKATFDADCATLVEQQP